MQCACAILSSVACLSQPYFSVSSHKWHDKKKSFWTWNVCFGTSATFVWNIARSKKNWAMCDINLMFFWPCIIVYTCFNYQLNAQFLYSIIIYYIIILDMFRAILCSSSGGQIVLLQHLISSLSVSGRTVHRCSPLSTGALYSCLQRVTIPDAVTTQFNLLRMSIVLLETCRGL
jgi:hypothetical protein